MCTYPITEFVQQLQHNKGGVLDSDEDTFDYKTGNMTSPINQWDSAKNSNLSTQDAKQLKDTVASIVSSILPLQSTP